MKIKMENTFGWPKNKIVGILSSGEEPVQLENMPIFSNYIERDFRITAEGFSKKREWSIQGKIPSFASAFIKPHMLRFDEETFWLTKTATSTTELKPHFWRKKILCKISVTWKHDSESKSIRCVDINMKVGLPLIGKKLESVIAEILKHNNLKYEALLHDSFAVLLGEPTG